MLLRSSSTPVIGSLVASFSAESRLGNNNQFEPKPSSIHNNKFSSFHNILHSSASSSPISPSIGISSGLFRRAQSECNLKDLAYSDYCEKNEDDAFFCDLYQHNNLRSKGITLQTIQSFSTNNSGGLGENYDGEDSDRGYDEKEEVEEVEGSESESGMAMKNLSLCEDMITVQKIWGGSFEEERREMNQEMYRAKGLGIDGGSSGGGRGTRDANWESGGGDGGDDNRKNVEEHYKKMVDEHPGNPLFLGNYANFLYETKRDLPLAEEYYSRLILANPNDGGILARKARVIWELHHDEDRALSYYERAVQAAPEDSHVHAAYASFLWETEEGDEDEDEADQRQDHGAMSTHIRGGIMTSSNAM